MKNYKYRSWIDSDNTIIIVRGEKPLREKSTTYMHCFDIYYESTVRVFPYGSGFVTKSYIDRRTEYL